MLVVPDTNAFHGDPRMRRRNFRIVLSEHRKGNFTLVMPEVVLDELPKRFQEQLANSREKYESAVTALETLGVVGLPSRPPTVTSERFQKELRQWLEQNEVRVQDLPDTSVAELYEQAIAERRPFQSGGRGFKDALIWRTVRDLAKQDEVVLITENWRDFAEGKTARSTLHEHLVEDLAADGHAVGQVKLEENLEDFIDRYVESAAIVLDGVRARLRSDYGWNQQMKEVVQHAFLDSDLRRQRVTITSSRNASVEFVGVDAAHVDECKIVEAYDTGDGATFSLEVEASAALDISFVADSSAAEWLAMEHADVEFDLFESTFAQGHTLGSPVTARFAIEYAESTQELGDAETLYVEDGLVADPVMKHEVTDPRRWKIRELGPRRRSGPRGWI